MKSTPLAISLSVSVLMPEASSAFAVHQRQDPAPGRYGGTSLRLYRSAAVAISEAERVCLVDGPHSERCAVAWDIVEELKAADAHDRAPATGASELSYVPLVQGLDLLSTKLQRKLGELKKLSTQMAEAGAGPEVERLIYASDEMTHILEEARTAMEQYR